MLARVSVPVLVGLMSSCSIPRAEAQQGAPRPSAAAFRFAVLSDVHVYASASLGGSACHWDGRKMLQDSEEILDSAVADLLAENLDFVLVSGDLTKDGERASHTAVAQALGRFREHGVEVYVVPGNHDIANPDSAGCRETEPVAAESVSAEDFARLYGPMGMGAALSRDPASLSYVVQLVPGVRLLALDSTQWEKNEPGKKNVAEGRIRTKTWGWIDAQLAAAREAGEQVIALMHHGVLDHYPNNRKHMAYEIVEQRERVRDVLRGGGVRLIFTGHAHANDVSESRGNGLLPFYDVQTGALVAWPNAYRIGTWGGGRLALETRHVVRTASHGESFAVYAENLLRTGMAEKAAGYLRDAFVSKRDAAALGRILADTYMIHVAGDEAPQGELEAPHGLGLAGRIAWGLKKGLGEDLRRELPPQDNRIAWNLQTWEPVE